MRKVRDRRPSTGTVLGSIALFVALGGTALAATGQLVHIADGTNAAKLATVTNTGALKVYPHDGSGPVTVDGTVQANVTNTARVSTSPQAPTRIDLATLTMSAGVDNVINCAQYTVPTGKDLVVVSSSGYLARAIGDNTALKPRFHYLNVDCGGGGLVNPLESDNPAFYSWTNTATFVVRNWLGQAAHRDDTSGTAYVKAEVYGYLVNEATGSARARAQSLEPSPALDAP